MSATASFGLPVTRLCIPSCNLVISFNLAFNVVNEGSKVTCEREQDCTVRPRSVRFPANRLVSSDLRRKLVEFSCLEYGWVSENHRYRPRL